MSATEYSTGTAHTLLLRKYLSNVYMSPCTDLENWRARTRNVLGRLLLLLLPPELPVALICVHVTVAVVHSANAWLSARARAVY